MTEQIVGNWFAQGGGRREKTIFATKVHGDMDVDPTDITIKRRPQAVKIRRACENSLKRLKTDYIDLYQMHHILSPGIWDEIWQAFETLVQQGKVIYVGSSNFAGWHIMAQLTARKRNFLGLVSEQSKYSLITRNIEQEVLPACRRFRIGVIPWSPLEGGILGGALEKQAQGRRAGEGAQKADRQVPPATRKVGRVLQRARRKTRRCRARLDAASPGDHRPDHRPAGDGAAHGFTSRSRNQTGRKRDENDRPDFPGTNGPKEDGQGTSDWKKYESPEAYAW